MSKRSDSERGTGGPSTASLVLAVINGSHSLSQLRYALGGRIAPHMIERMVNDLHTRQILSKGRGGLITATTKGREQYARNIERPMQPYVPPQRPPVRAGSLDFLALPSVAAGIARPYRHPI